ncbi:MAG: type VII toxin-antitoxin system MntA family adenylyltransferase antitoxin [Anaeroplasmataceae bacterium]
MDLVRRIVIKTLSKHKIDICYLFGSFVSETFLADSDIDIAVLGDVSELELLPINVELETLLGIEVDLVKADKVYPIIQTSIASSGELLFCKSNKLLEEFLMSVDNWYSTEFSFYLSTLKEDY